jgi:hypothetical protein
MMDNINTGLKSQKDIEMRTELFQVLQRVKNSIDCAATLAAPVTDGSPIEIYKRNASGVVLVGLNGSNFGRFSIVANKLPGDLIEIKAASFITPPSEPRSMLNAPDSSFTKKKIGTNVWSWVTTGSLMAMEFSELSILCDGYATAPSTSAPSGGAILPDFYCPPGKALVGASGGAPICEGVQDGHMGNPVMVGGGMAGSQSNSAPLKWRLDKDCGKKYPDCQDPSTDCYMKVPVYCPPNPGATICPGILENTKCITPNGCLKYECKGPY